MSNRSPSTAVTAYGDVFRGASPNADWQRVRGRRAVTWPRRNAAAMARDSCAAVRLLGMLLVLAHLPAGLVASPSGSVAEGPDLQSVSPAAILNDAYRHFLHEEEVQAFVGRVSAYFREPALARLLTDDDVTTRRAAALALRLTGTIRSNRPLARALRDDDPVVRIMAQQAMWTAWRRAGTKAQNKKLAEITGLVGGAEPDKAAELATDLISEAPEFAEAYNQRAIAHFIAERYRESIEDCKRVLERNPYHFGAASGMGKCHEKLNEPVEALGAYRRALEINPHLEGARATVRRLQRQLDR